MTGIDPVGAATAAGKGLIDAADSGVGKALFLPAATEYGAYFGEIAREWVAKQRDRRMRNLTAQLLLAQRIATEQPFSAHSEEQIYSEWMEGASNVDPDEIELTSIWQAAYLVIRDRKGLVRRRLLRIAKTMEVDEAAALIEALRPEGKVSFVDLWRRVFSLNPYMEKIVSSGLIFPRILIFLVTWIPVSTMLAYSGHFAVLNYADSLPYPGNVAPWIGELNMWVVISAFLFGTSFATILALTLLLPTRDGRVLRGSLKKVLSELRSDY